MINVKPVGFVGLACALLAAAACGDSSKPVNPTSPSAVVAGSVSAESGDGSAESGATAKGGIPGRPTTPPGNGNGRDKGGPPTNSSPDAPSATNPITGKVEIEGLITAIAGSAITVNGQTVAVPLGTVIRHGSLAVAFAELGLGDRVHVRARMQGTALEATEVKLQNPGGVGDDDGGEGETGGTVFVSLLDPTASEGSTDTGAFRLTRVPSATLPLTSPLTVTFSLSGTATNGVDYTTIPLTATFAAGSASVDINVSPIADALAEGSESVILTLTGAAPYTLGSPTAGTVTISDAAPVVSVTAFDATASETGPALGTFRFTRTGSVTSSLTVTYTVSGTAVNGTDYQAIPLTVTFLAGQATTDVFVIPAADGAIEADETVIATLSDGATYDLGAPATATATVTISD